MKPFHATLIHYDLKRHVGLIKKGNKSIPVLLQKDIHCLNVPQTVTVASTLNNELIVIGSGQ